MGYILRGMGQSLLRNGDIPNPKPEQFCQLKMQGISYLKIVGANVVRVCHMYTQKVIKHY